MYITTFTKNYKRRRTIDNGEQRRASSSPALEVGSRTPPDQWTHHRCSSFHLHCRLGPALRRTGGRITAAVVLTCIAGQVPQHQPISSGEPYSCAATSCFRPCGEPSSSSIAIPAAPHKGPGTFSPAEPRQRGRPQATAARSA
jgi:hypothetical protein